MALQVPVTPWRLRLSRHRVANRCHRPAAEVQPRCGVTLGSVQRFLILVPRLRQAPDGEKY